MNNLRLVWGDPLVCDLSIHIRNMKHGITRRLLFTIIEEDITELNALTQLLKKGTFKSLRGMWCIFPDGLFFFFLNKNIYLKDLFGILFSCCFLLVCFFFFGGVLHFFVNRNGFKGGLYV